MVAVVAFVDGERAGIMIILGDFSGKLSLFAGVVDNLVIITYPTTLGLVDLIWV